MSDFENIYKDTNSFIEIYGQDDVFLSGNPNFSVCNDKLGFIGNKHKIFESADHLLLNGELLRHTNTDYNIVDLTISNNIENKEFHYNVSQQLSPKYQYLTKIFIVTSNCLDKFNELIDVITVNVGGTNFTFSQTELQNYNFYKRNIITEMNITNFVLDLPLPLLNNNTVLPLFENFDITITIKLKKATMLTVSCTVIQADSEETRRLNMMFNYVNDEYDYISDHIDLNQPFLENKSYKHKPLTSFTTEKINNYFRMVELAELIQVDQANLINDDSICVNSKLRPNKEIFICKPHSLALSNIELIITQTNPTNSTNNLTKSRKYSSEQMKLSQLANYSKYNYNYGYIPFTLEPNNLQHTGEISCENIHTFIKFDSSEHLNDLSIITYGNALIHFYHDLADKKIKCKIVKQCAKYNYDNLIKINSPLKLQT